MAKFLTAVQRYMTVDEATSAKDDVTPVYLLDEVYQMAVSGQDVPGLVDHLIKRLQHRSPVVKHKTLRVIKYVAGKNAPEFRRLFSRHAAAIRDLTSFRGEQDAFKGDVPNQRVRDMAKETLDALFAVQEAPSFSQQRTQSLAAKGRMQGFGSAAPDPSASSSSAGHAGGYGGSGSYSGGSNSYGGSGSFPGQQAGSSKYVGFGNPRMPAPPQQQSAAAAANAALDTAKQWLSVGISSIPGLTNSRTKSLTAHENGGQYGGYAGTYNAPASMGGEATYASAPYARPSAAASPARGASGDDEARAVSAICTPGGLRPQPDRADLTNFVEAASMLDGAKVARLLQDAMAAGPWQATLRALCALEAVINQGSSASCAAIVDHFQEDASEVQRAAGSVQASVRIRGNAVLQQLGLGVAQAPDAPVTAVPARAASKPAAPEPSLLDFGDDQPAPAPATATPAAAADPLADLLGGGSPLADTNSTAAVGGGEPDGLFSGLNLSPAPSATAVAAASNSDGDSNLFGGLSVSVQPPAHAANGDGLAGLLNGLELAGSSYAPAVPPTAPASTASRSSGLGDLLNVLPSSSGGSASYGNGGVGGYGGVAALAPQPGSRAQAPPGNWQQAQPGSMAQAPPGNWQQAGTWSQMGMMQPGFQHAMHMPTGVPMGYVPVTPNGAAFMQHGSTGMQSVGMAPTGMHSFGVPAMPPHSAGFGLSKANLGPMGGANSGVGPIPLDAFASSAAYPPPAVPKAEDKFDGLLGDVLGKGK